MKKYKKQMILIASLIAVLCLGLYTKMYHGPYSQYINNNAGGAFYVIFFTLLVALLKPKSKYSNIVYAVLLVTILIEWTQLIKTDYLIGIRQNEWVRLLIGTTFSWSDFPPYLIGAAFCGFYFHYFKKI